MANEPPLAPTSASARGTARSGRVAQAFAASGAATARGAADAVRAQLDGYAARWIAKRREVCRATFERGEQSERVMGLRFGCLERRRGELAALSALLASADRGVVNKALAAVSELPGLDGCDDVAALDSLAPPPRDPARARQLAEVQAEVDRAVAQRRAGQYQEGLAAAPATLARAETLAHPPLVAAALSAYADLENWGGDAVHAEALYRRAARIYAEVGDDAGLAGAWMTLVFVVGVLEGKPAEGAALGEFAATLVARRRDKVMTAQLENHLGGVAFGAGELEAAAAHFDKALALRREVLGPEHLAVASTLANLGAVRRQEERYDEAQALGEEGLAIRARLLGEEHPEVAVSLRNLAALAISRGQLARARELESKAMAIHRRASGEEHFEVANSLTNLGQTYMEEHDYAQAVSYQERALATYRKGLPASHPLIGKAAFSLGEGLAGLHRWRESLRASEEGLTILDVPGGNPVDRAHAAYQVALALGALGEQPARARRLMTEARDTYRDIGADKWQGMAEGWLKEHP
jgi:serine/threonine-protein kinase